MPETATTNAFGARLKAIRQHRGISQRWLCREIGRGPTAVYEIETGDHCPTAETLMRLADVLGFTMDELYRGVGRCEGTEPARKGSIVEAFEALRAAGGHAWDEIDDPAEYLGRNDDD